MSYVGRSVPRVDARDKAAGRAMYAADLCDRRALTAKILHAEQAHALVKRIDAEKARAMDGVEAVFTCFDVPKNYFPTAGHPWSTEPEHQDVADRLLLTDHVRFWGDEIAVVVAQDELTAQKALREIEVEYEPLPFVLDVQKAMEPGAPQLHEAFPGNVLGHSSVRIGDYEAAIKEPGLIKVEGWYDTPTVQHCHIENHNCWAYMEGGRVVVVTSTQIPHIVRRIVGQALGIPWGQVRIIKPYIGGGFGNKQDALYEPLCAWLTTQLGGKPVRIECAREETFHCNRVRHAIRSHIISWVRPDGSFAARKLECWSNQGAYASHGHGIAAKGMNSFPQIYPCPNIECDSWTAFTNLPPAGAMRGYGIPQATFAGEAHIDDVAKALNMNPLELRRKIAMPKGYKDEFSKNVNWSDSFRACMEAGAKATDFERLYAEYAKPQTGSIRRGVGMALYWYNTGVWPISLESSSCRMVLNQDGSIQVQTGETEIGQGCDTVYAQMAADAVGVPFGSVHVVSSQDTDVTPYGSGAYASRQTYVGGFAIAKTGALLRERILDYAHKLTRMPVSNLDLVEGRIVRKPDGEVLMDLAELATEALYSMEDSRHLTAEATAQIKSNAYSFGCSYAEVEVDMKLCKVKVLRLMNVHD
ncbi:MAG TPA: xanthine dehydrogenase molybdenum-binding subunit XdhA, partial [Candidatus Scatomorpha intestinigallinarum]|nr:xanthine dehydrogenase molybdenum-binding subunit XdhA [Candidatus Scatomorpha intestinigallinarum]